MNLTFSGSALDIVDKKIRKSGVHKSRLKTGSGRVAELPKGVLELKSWVCRTCLRRRPMKDFYTTTDPKWDTNGHMATCRFCIDDAYERFCLSENSMDKAILKLCRILNVKYDGRAVESTKKNIETIKNKGKVIGGVFGIYRKSLNSDHGGFSSEGELTFQGSGDFVSSDSLRKFSDSQEDIEYLESSWGKAMELEDYSFLEEVFAKWTRTTKCDTYAEELLVRELCHKENEIRKRRISGEPTDNLVKGLQDIMKNSALTPALQNAAASGRYADAFGVWIKDIEGLTPAEWYLDQKKYKDIEGIEEYNNKYITRSIKNFITGSRDFNVEETLDMDKYDIDEE